MPAPTEMDEWVFIFHVDYLRFFFFFLLNEKCECLQCEKMDY